MPATPTLDTDGRPIAVLDPLNPDGPDAVLVDTIRAGYAAAVRELEVLAFDVAQARDRFYRLTGDLDGAMARRSSLGRWLLAHGIDPDEATALEETAGEADG